MDNMDSYLQTDIQRRKFMAWIGFGITHGITFGMPNKLGTNKGNTGL